MSEVPLYAPCGIPPFPSVGPRPRRQGSRGMGTVKKKSGNPPEAELLPCNIQPKPPVAYTGPAGEGQKNIGAMVSRAGIARHGPAFDPTLSPVDEHSSPPFFQKNHKR